MIIIKGQAFRELRCIGCRALLALEYIYAGRLSIKCHVCNTTNTIDCRTTKKVLLEKGVMKNTTFIGKNEKGGEKIE
jgi:LSD1 subclass zinc finger protein